MGQAPATSTAWPLLRVYMWLRGPGHLTVATTKPALLTFILEKSEWDENQNGKLGYLKTALDPDQPLRSLLFLFQNGTRCPVVTCEDHQSSVSPKTKCQAQSHDMSFGQIELCGPAGQRPSRWLIPWYMASRGDEDGRKQKIALVLGN